MKITANIQNNVISINYAGLGISIDRNEILNSADAIINLLNILPFPADVRKDMVKDLDKVKPFLPIFRKFSDALVYKNDSSAEIIFNEDGTIDMSQTEVQSMIDLPKIISAIVEFNELKDRLKEERRKEYEAWEKEIFEEKEREEEDRNTRIDSIHSDQGMIDNEITFFIRPTFESLCYQLNINPERAQKHMAKHQGIMLTIKQKLSSEATRIICDEYGFEANIQWPDEFATVSKPCGNHEEETE